MTAHEKRVVVCMAISERGCEMKVKELKKELKGQYTDIVPFHTDRRNAIPFTQLGREFDGKYGKAFDKVLDEKEVVEYKLGEWKETYSWTMNEFVSGSAGKTKVTRQLIIYFK